jgi:dTDP-4-dehydrorhamnose 3,5-epimerase-like enzyme
MDIYRDKCRGMSSDNFKQLYIPEGFTHGFSVLSEEVEVLYINCVKKA